MNMKCVSLAGKNMRVIVTDSAGVVGDGTTLRFNQQGNIVWAEYSGGRIANGALVGVRYGNSLDFHYAQQYSDGAIDTGRSRAIVREADGRLQIEEHFEWGSREGSGVNVFEEIRVTEEANPPRGEKL
jgi:hypothetical protein